VGNPSDGNLRAFVRELSLDIPLGEDAAKRQNSVIATDVGPVNAAMVPLAS